MRAAVTALAFSLLAQVAIYWFAVSYGARPPVEGVPFLSIVVAVLGALLALVTIVSVYGVPLALTALSWLGSRIFSKERLQALRELNFTAFVFGRAWGQNENESDDVDTRESRESALKFRRFVLLTYAFLVSVGFAWAFLAALLDIPGSEVIRNYVELFPRLLTQGDNGFMIGILTIYAFIFILLGSVFINRVHRAFIANGLFLAGFVSLVVLTFSDYFLSLLRFTRFGGGIEVIVTLDGRLVSERLNLIYQTRDNLVLYDSNSATVRDVTKEYVSSIEYVTDAVAKLPKKRTLTDILTLDEFGAGKPDA